MSVFYNLIASLVLLALCALQAMACASADGRCAEVGAWDLSLGVGVGVRSNPLLGAADIPLRLVPQISYSGERFFVQNLDVGMVIAETEHQQFNVLLTPSYDQVFFKRSGPQNLFMDSHGMLTPNNSADVKAVDPNAAGGGDTSLQPTPARHKRHTAALAGVEYSLETSVANLQLQFLHDLTQVHNGDELRVSVSLPWQYQKHRFNAALGANWQSAAVLNYYYGVRASEADARGRYDAGSGISTLARLEWNYALSEKVELRALGSYRVFADAISASPLLQDTNVITVFIGGVYHF